MTEQRTRRMVVLGVIGLALMLAAGAALAGGGYTLPWWTFDGGGGTSAGGAFSLSGTIGQPDAWGASGGAYALSGGFWAGDAVITSPGGGNLYLPVIQR